MLKVRLQRVGRKHDPSFRVVVTEHTRGPKSNNFVEILGHYDARVDKNDLNIERINYWQSVGAKLSDTVHNILVKKGAIRGKKRKNSQGFVAKVEEPVAVAAEPAPAENKVDDGQSSGNDDVAVDSPVE